MKLCPSQRLITRLHITWCGNRYSANQWICILIQFSLGICFSPGIIQTLLVSTCQSCLLHKEQKKQQGKHNRKLVG